MTIGLGCPFSAGMGVVAAKEFEPWERSCCFQKACLPTVRTLNLLPSVWSPLDSPPEGKFGCRRLKLLFPHASSSLKYRLNKIQNCLTAQKPQFVPTQQRNIFVILCEHTNTERGFLPVFGRVAHFSAKRPECKKHCCLEMRRCQIWSSPPAKSTPTLLSPQGKQPESSPSPVIRDLMKEKLPEAMFTVSGVDKDPLYVA